MDAKGGREPLTSSLQHGATLLTSSFQSASPNTGVDRARWGMLFLFCLGSATNACLWVTFTPIAVISTQYYGVSPLCVDLLSVMFMFLYLPGLMVSVGAYRRSLRFGMLLGNALQALGAVVRCASCGNYAVLLCGQALAALGQPLFTNLPPKLAATWFSVEERDLATVVGAMSNALGAAAGQILPSLLVDEDGRGIEALLCCQAGLAGGVLLATAVAFRSEPAQPPSKTQALLRAARERTGRHTFRRGSSLAGSPRAADATEGSGAQDAALSEQWRDVVACLQDTHFRRLVVAFGIGLGLFNAMITLINQMTSPLGYNDNDASLFGGMLIVCGLFGAGAVGAMLDRRHNYNFTLKAGFCAAMGVEVVFFLAMRPDNRTALAVMFGVLGVVMMPMLPCALECGVECTYPIAEDVSSGLLMLAGQVWGIPLTFALGKLLEAEKALGHYTFTPSYGVMLAGNAVACCFVLAYQGPLRRFQAERSPPSSPA